MNELFPGIDGMSPRGELVSDTCCPPSFCDIAPCQMTSSYIGLLPSGPLWDRPKYEAQMIMQRNGDCTICWDCDHCPSMVDYAVNVGQRLHYLLMHSLWPSVRESDPFTAYSSTAEWLERFNWIDCFKGNCRPAALGEVTPIEYLDDCDEAVQVDIRYTPKYQRALESAIIKSLQRMQMGVIKNLAAINFVIEPLKARIVPVDDAPSCDLDEICLQIEKTSDFFDGVTADPCGKPEAFTAYINRDIMQLDSRLPLYIWPGHMAAECIVRSLLSHSQRFCLLRPQQLPEGV